MENLANKISSRLETLRSLRKPHEQVWKECFDFSFPVRGTGFNSEVVNSATIQRKKSQLWILL